MARKPKESGETITAGNTRGRKCWITLIAGNALRVGHEWERELQPAQAHVVKDALGTVLANGDSVILIKDLKLKDANLILG